MKKTLISFLLCMVALAASAKSTINGLLVDANDTTALISATVKLLKANKDSSYVTGVITDANGVFNIEGVSPGKYVVKCTYLGYTDVTRRVTVSSEGKGVNLGAIPMAMSGVLLKEAVVHGVKTAITVKEDTIEYNADTYKTQANAVVEDVLKRMPGIEVGSDGKITANGKSVTKILIDGQEFFSDDPTVASKNIPASMVEKLQVIDRKSDLARLTGVDDGEDETVINLTVKKGMNNGWFGTATAGYGTDNRYNGRLMANYFHNGNQLTIMGGGNNVNSLGFSDGGAQRFHRFGGDNGITTSQNLGLNFNTGKEEGVFRAGGSVMYSHSDRDVVSSNDRQYLFPDSASYYNSSSKARDKGHNIRGDFRMVWKPDSFNTVEFRPNFAMNFSNSEKADSSLTSAGDALRSLVNRSVGNYHNDGTSYNFGGQLVYTHNFKYHRGRSYSAMFRYNYSNTDEDADTYTLNNYYLLDSAALINQTSNSKRITNTYTGRLTWTEPLGDVSNARFLVLAYRGTYKRSTADKMVYDIDGDDQLWNEGQSNQFRNTYFNQSFELGFRQVRKAYNLNVGMSVNSAMSKSTDLINSARDIAARWSWSVAPYARLRYKFSKTRNLGFDYRMRASEPSLTQLQPVADESNPLNITVGNPELKATFTHRINLRFSDFAQGAQRSLMAMLGVNFVQNSIVSKTTTNATTGGRVSTYENVNGVWNAFLMNMLSFPFTSSKVMYFTNHMDLHYNVNKGFINSEENTNSAMSLNLAPGLAFRNGYFDLELNPTYELQTTHNSLKTGTTMNSTVHTYGGKFNGSYTSAFGLMLSSDVAFTTTSGYSSGYNTSQWIWNASLGYQFLKGKTASIQVSVFDILAQKKSVTRTTTESYIQDSYYNNLGRYGMLTFTYRFSSFKKGEEPKQEFQGPGGDGPGPGRGGGAPMGPPPGGFGGGGPRF